MAVSSGGLETFGIAGEVDEATESAWGVDPSVAAGVDEDAVEGALGWSERELPSRLKVTPGGRVGRH